MKLLLAALALSLLVAAGRPPPRSQGGGGAPPAESTTTEGGARDLELVVVASDGRPVEELRVVAMILGDPASAGGWLRVAGGGEWESADGRLRVEDAAPGTWELAIVAEGLARAVLRDVRVPCEEPLRVTLRPPATIRGRVVLPDGSPAARAHVAPWEPPEDYPNHRGFWRPWEEAFVALAEPPLGARTDAQGRFEIAGVVPGEHVLAASLGRFAPSEPGAVLALAGEVAEVELALRRPDEAQAGASAPRADEQELDPSAPPLPRARLAGRVVDAAGEPVPRAALFAAGPPPLAPGGRSVRRLWADDRGRFELDGLEPGAWRVVAGPPSADDEPTFWPGAPTRAAAVVSLRADEAAEVELVLAPHAGIDVLARGPDGAPLEGVGVVALAADGRQVGGAGEPPDSRGRARIEGLPAGRDLILARGRVAVSAPVEIDLSPGERGQVELDCARGGGLVVSVDAPDRRPARVRVLDARGLDHAVLLASPHAEELLPDGSLRLRPLAPDRYRVVAETRDGRAAEAGVEVASGEEARVRLAP